VPLLRYFLFVGGCLVALLFIADATMPLPEVAAKAATSDIDRSIIRITSQRKTTAAIVFDTTQPTMAAVPVAPIPVATTETRPEPVRQAFAQMQPDVTKAPKPVEAKLVPSKTKKAKIAKRQNMIAFRQDPSRELFPTW
jgi:hypothetical protein